MVFFFFFFFFFCFYQKIELDTLECSLKYHVLFAKKRMKKKYTDFVQKV